MIILPVSSKQTFWSLCMWCQFNFSKGQRDSCVGDNQETWGQLGLNAVTVGKYINLLTAATSFSGKCSIIRHQGYHHFFTEYSCDFVVVVVWNHARNYAQVCKAYSQLQHPALVQVNIIIVIISIRQRKWSCADITVLYNLKNKYDSRWCWQRAFWFLWCSRS